MEPKQQNIAWVDILRIAACFLVVIAHCCDPFVANFNNKTEFMTGASFGSAVRSCVPLFVMISGVLLLPSSMEMRTFYSRRLKRVLIPLVIWSLVLPLLYYFYFLAGAQTVNPNIDPNVFTLEATLKKLYLFLINFTYDTIPFWYLYMLVGLYLLIPVISPWLREAKQKDIKLFLYFWLASLCVPYLTVAAPYLGYTGNYESMDILGGCLWNPFGTFYYFAGFVGYLVLGHYLARFPLNWSWGKTLGIAIPLFLAGYALTLYGFLIAQELFPGDYSKLEIPWYFCSINVLMMTSSVFIVIQRIKIPASPLLSKLASLTFGVYLCHFFIVQVAYDLIYPNSSLAPWFKLPLIGVTAFACSLLLTWLLSLTKWTRKSIM